MTQNNKEYFYGKDSHGHDHDSIYLEDNSHICGLCGLDIWEIDDNIKKLPSDVKKQLFDYTERISKINFFKPKLDIKYDDASKKIKKFLGCFGINADIEFRKIENMKDGYNAAYEKREATWSPMIYKINDEAEESLKKLKMTEAYSSVSYTVARIIRSYFTSNYSEVSDTINGNISPVVFAKKSNWSATISSAFRKVVDQTKDYEYKDSSDFSRRTEHAQNQLKYDVWFALADLLALNDDKYREKFPDGVFLNILSVWECGLYPIGMINGKFVVYVPSIDGEFPKQF